MNKEQPIAPQMANDAADELRRLRESNTELVTTLPPIGNDRGSWATIGRDT